MYIVEEYIQHSTIVDALAWPSFINHYANITLWMNRKLSHLLSIPQIKSDVDIEEHHDPSPN